ncbi:hypothetical protein [Actinomadura sp. 9N407]|uniref:hypothetical protein n=1 Tax=Actinomadura sp. 9N407 TaxID=3375154 RepID=UPI00379F71DE
MSNPYPPGGQSGPPPGPYGPGSSTGPGQSAGPYGAGASEQRYALSTKRPIVHLPVMLNGHHVGYLWAGVDDRSAGFIRRNEFLEEAYEAPFVWGHRLDAAYAEGTPAREAIRSWIGRPEDPKGGGVPAGAEERPAVHLKDLRLLANPDIPPSPWGSIADGELPDGSPMDRSEGWGPLHMELPPGYALTTGAPVRYLPVAKDAVVLGYLWAAVTGGAAFFVPREDAGAPGNAAMGSWVLRLRELYAQGVPASDVLSRCRTMPEDPTAGGVPLDAHVEELPSLDDLRRHAAVYEQSLRVSYNPVQDEPGVVMRPALAPGERDEVLRYLREAPVVYDSGNVFPDGFDPARPARVPDTYQTDGTWIWLGGVPYHLEVHGVPPEPDLVAHIRAHRFQVPALDAVDRDRAKRTLRWRGILVPPPV